LKSAVKFKTTDGSAVLRLELDPVSSSEGALHAASAQEVNATKTREKRDDCA
jgi:hypothetical protein